MSIIGIFPNPLQMTRFNSASGLHCNDHFVRVVGNGVSNFTFSIQIDIMIAINHHTGLKCIYHFGALAFWLL